MTQQQREKAYNQGCMWGMGGRDNKRCPYPETELAQWWQQGWEAGMDAWVDRVLKQHPAEHA